MPQATVNSSSDRKQLRTIEEGYVDLRRMTYGQYLERRDMATKTTMETGGPRRGVTEAEIRSMQRKVAAFEFKCCIEGHNLTDEDDNPLDFGSDRILDILDPRVGQEIGALIDEMNQFEEEVKG